jgi:hypothetical protein
MAYKVTQSAVPARLTAQENFLCNSMTADTTAGAYQVRSYGVLIGLATADGKRYVNANKYTGTTSRHQGMLRTAWGAAQYELVNGAQINKLVSK